MRVRALILAVMVLTPVGGLPAQDQDLLGQVEALLAQGRVEEARSTLLVWWESDLQRASRMDRQRGLWLRGQLTVDPALAELDFRRLTVEYPGGAYSDQAHFRLALLAEARGEGEEALAHLRTLARDYPTSPLRPGVEEKLRQALPPEPLFTKVTATRLEPHQGPILEGNRHPYAAQVGAFRSMGGALSLSQRLRAAGEVPRLVKVPGSDLIRVRVGRFATREEAAVVIRELERRGFEATLSTDALGEEEIR